MMTVGMATGGSYSPVAACSCVCHNSEHVLSPRRKLTAGRGAVAARACGPPASPHRGGGGGGGAAGY